MKRTRKVLAILLAMVLALSAGMANGKVLADPQDPNEVLYPE